MSERNDIRNLKDLLLAPYIIKATALIGVSRRIGGNQFRHAFATLGILLDYKYFNDGILLKASLLHDLFEDISYQSIAEIRSIDAEADKVVDLVLEVTRRQEETKEEYLLRVLEHGSVNANILKCADRISNLTDLHLGVFTPQKVSDYLDQTEKFVIPMGHKVNEDMAFELADLVERRRRLL